MKTESSSSPSTPAIERTYNGGAQCLAPSRVCRRRVVVNQSSSDEFLRWILLLPYDDIEVEIGWRFTRSNLGPWLR